MFFFVLLNTYAEGFPLGKASIYAEGFPLGTACDGRQVPPLMFIPMPTVSMPRGSGSRRHSSSYAEGGAMPRGFWAYPTPLLPEELRRGCPSAETCAEGDKGYAEGFPPSAQLLIPVVINLTCLLLAWNLAGSSSLYSATVWRNSWWSWFYLDLCLLCSNFSLLR